MTKENYEPVSIIQKMDFQINPKKHLNLQKRE